MAKRRSQRLKTSETGIALIQQFEGLKLTAYPDPGTGHAPWTIGYGHTGPEVKRGLTWTAAQASEHLRRDLEKHENRVRTALDGASTTQSQFDALVSFDFNTGALHRSTLLKLHKAGNYRAAAAEFYRWRFASGRVLKGLIRRRAAERDLYLSG